MCVAFPAIAGLGMAATAGAQVANYAAQSSAASNAAEYQNKRYSAVSVEALRDYFLKTDQINQRQDQETLAAGDQAMQINAAARAEQGAYRTYAGESGVSGNTAKALMRQFEAISATNQLVTETNLKWNRNQLDLQKQGYYAEAKSRIAGAAPQPVQAPSLLGLGLGLVGGASQGVANNYDKFFPPKTGVPIS